MFRQTTTETSNFHIERTASPARSPIFKAGETVSLNVPGWREWLYSEMQPLIRKLVRRYSDCPDSRQDLAGELYYRFCSLLEEFDPERGIPLRGYLIRQLSAAAYTHARSRWRRRRQKSSLDAAPHIVQTLGGPDPSSEWDNRIVQEMFVRHLREEIGGLPQRQRQVLVGRYYDGRSFEDIADVMGIEPATARSLLRHALQNLRKQIGTTAARFELVA